MNNTSSGNPDSSDAFGFEIDFLPVGETEGDAICMRWGYHLDDPSRRRQFVMVVDGGYQGDGQAIVRHLKKWYGMKHDVKINVMANTHPDQDHISGLEEIFNEPGVKVEKLIMQRPWNISQPSTLFEDNNLKDEYIQRIIKEELSSAVQLEKTAKRICKSEIIDAIQGGPLICELGVACWALSPSTKDYRELFPYFSFTPGEAKDIGDVRVKPKKGPWYLNRLQDDGATSASNESSLVLCLVLPIQGRNVVLLTGDAGQTALGNAVSYAEHQGIDLPSRIKFFQVPHHGSAQNLGPTVLERLFGPGKNDIHRKPLPISAVASVGKHPDSMHPSQQIINELACHGVIISITKGSPYRFRLGNLNPRPGWGPAKKVPPIDNLDETTDSEKD